MKRSCCGLLVAGLGLLGSLNGWAEAPPIQMEEVVVTGTRTREEVKNIPNAVTVIGPAEIEHSSANNLGELLKENTTLDVNDYGSLGSEQSVSIWGSSPSQVLVMIDNRPVNSITYGSADLSQIMLDNVERIEIVKGPTSHLYGANAMGGVINVITKNPPAKPSFKAGVSYGTFNTQTYGAEHGQTLGRFGYLISAGYKSSDGPRDNSKYEGKDISSKLTYQLLDRLSLSLLTTAYQDGLGVPGPKPAAGTIPPFGNSQVTSLYDHQDDNLFNNTLQMRWEPTDRLEVRWQGYQDYRELLYRQMYQGYPSNQEEHDTYRANIYGTSLDVRWDFHKDHKLTIGTDYRREDLNGEQKIKDMSTSTITTTRWFPDNNLWGIFAQEHWQALSQLRVVAGLRYDSTDRYGSETSPDLGLVYSPWDLTHIKLHYGQAFRPPTFNDLFWPGGGNTQLSAEKGTSYEITFDQGLKDKILNFSVSLFRWQVTDKIQWVPDDKGNWQPQNVNEQNTWGGDISLNWNPLKDLTVAIGYTFLDSIQKNRELQNALLNTTEIVERRAASIPQQQGRVSVTYLAPWKTRINLVGRYVGDRVMYYSDYSAYPAVTQLEKTIGSYFTMDLKFSQPFAKHWIGTLSILNLADVSYVAQPGTSYSDQGYPSPGRMITAGIKYVF
jgi:outer membrane cobalamin receptor